MMWIYGFRNRVGKMQSILSCGYLVLLLSSLSHALDILSTKGNYFVNEQGKSFITVGSIYSVSNSTTDVSSADPLANAETCTRDAALMQRLGFNTIWVLAIDPTKNHDACFSIFNAVGIYIIVDLRPGETFSQAEANASAAYSFPLMQQTFAIIDSVKDYDNLMAVSAGSIISYDPTQNLTVQQKLSRAMIRDTKEYIKNNAKRYIPVGITVTLSPGFGLDAVPIGDMLNYFQCTTTGTDDDISRSDFLGLEDFANFDNQSAILPGRNKTWTGAGGLSENTSDTSIPIMFSDYRSYYGSQSPYQMDDSWPDTALIYSINSQLLAPYGPLSGGLVWEWSNVQSLDSTNWGIVNIDEEGNVKLKKAYDGMKNVLSQLNLDSFYGAYDVGESEIFTAPVCAASIMTYEAASTVSGKSQIQTGVATDWSFPTPPPGLEALISYGNNGTRGQLVDVTVTTVVQTVVDSSGSLVKGLVITPSSSTPRVVTGTAISNATSMPTFAPSGGLSTGAKAGIGVGAAIGGLLLIGALGFFLLRRRQSKKPAIGGNDETKYEPGVPGQYKPELPGNSAHREEMSAYPPERAPLHPQELPAPIPTYEMEGDSRRSVHL